MATGQFLRKIGMAGVALVLALGLAACAGGGYTRGVFYGYVMGKTEAEITEKIGKPESVERKGSDSVRLVYSKKTFNPDDSNRVDQQTIVILSRDPKGNLVATDVEFT